MEMESLKVPTDLLSNTRSFWLRNSPPFNEMVCFSYPTVQALFEVVESRHKEKFLQEKFRVQHSNVGSSAYQCVGGVW